MKKISFIFLLFLGLSTIAQEKFKGVVFYKSEINGSEVKPEQWGVSEDHLVAYTDSVFNEGGNAFYFTSNGSLFDIGSQQLFYIDNLHVTCADEFCMPTTVYDPQFLEIEDLKETTTIFDMKCKIAVVKSEAQIDTMYYATNFLKVDTAGLKAYVGDPLYYFIYKRGCLPIRYIAGGTYVFNILNYSKIEKNVFEMIPERSNYKGLLQTRMSKPLAKNKFLKGNEVAFIKAFFASQAANENISPYFKLAQIKNGSYKKLNQYIKSFTDLEVKSLGGDKYEVKFVDPATVGGPTKYKLNISVQADTDGSLAINLIEENKSVYFGEILE